MSTFYDNYTNIVVIGNKLGIRLRDPQTKQPSYYKISKYQPSTFSLCNPQKATDNWKTLDGRSLRKIVHPDIRAYQEYVDAAEKEGRQIFGVISPIQQFFAEEISPSCGVPFDAIRIAFMDIEVSSEGGFATPEDPFQPITAITVEVWGEYYVWGCGDYDASNSNIHYKKCKDEIELLESFIRWWTQDYPDVITGWNITGYDIPYIINRIDFLNNEGQLNMSSSVMSPWRKLGIRIANIMGRDQKLVDIYGISTLDYLELYRKFSLTERESYRLDFIAEMELGKNKVSYDEYGSLQRLATENYQKFIDYNIYDVTLVKELNNKLHHLDLCIQIAYGARVNFPDTFKQVRLWDSMMYYTLYERQIAVPMKIKHTKDVEYLGAYVKDPIVGEHSWVVSFDVNSLYPSIMRQWNISPDRHLTIDWLKTKLADVELLRGAFRKTDFTAEDCTPREWLDTVNEEDAAIVRWALDSLINYIERSDIDNMLRDTINIDDPWPWLRVLSVCITPNQQAFRADSHGFLSEILARLYEERKIAKNKETAAKKLAEQTTNPEEKLKYEAEAIQWGLQQNTRKINLNSCYGAVGNKFFRFFDTRQAEAVTSAGQLIIRYVAHVVNEYLNKEFGTNRDYVLASDTDSIYVTLAPVVSNMGTEEAITFLDSYCANQMQHIIDDAFNTIAAHFNTPDKILGMKREAIAEYGVWTAKKRYLLWVHDNEGVRYQPPKLKTVGIEAVRSSTPKIARNSIKNAIEHFIRRDKDKFYTLLDEVEHLYMTRPFEEIASPRGCNKLGKYPILDDGNFSLKTPIQIKGALAYNRHLEQTDLLHKYPIIREGEKIRFCYLKPHNPLKCNVIAAPNALPTEWNLEQFLDRQEQFQKTVIGPLEKIIKFAGWDIRPIVTLF